MAETIRLSARTGLGEAMLKDFCYPFAKVRDRMTGHADHYLPTDARKIPLGPKADLAGTRFDFRKVRPVILDGDQPLDHSFCLNADAKGNHPICVLETPSLRLEIESNTPGVQICDAAHKLVDGAVTRSGHTCSRHVGLAIEPLNWPDAPNQSGYPDITLSPGQTFRQVSRFCARMKV